MTDLNTVFPHTPFLLCIGESLVDLVSDETGRPLCEVNQFHRFWGGSVTNVAATTGLLGHPVILVAAVGADPLGEFILSSLSQCGVLTDRIQVIPQMHTSIVMIAHGPTGNEFLPFHQAHTQVPLKCLSVSLIQAAWILHTSAFSLMHEPLCSTVLWALTVAAKAGVMTSMDVNYHTHMWKDPDKGRAVVRLALHLVDIVKVSEEDAAQFLGQQFSPEEVIGRYHALGSKTVIYTAGARGVWASDNRRIFHIPASSVTAVVNDVGAGDAFWAGFLSGMLDAEDVHTAVQRGIALAARKISQYGPLAQPLERYDL
ncbi:MAG: sugar kinase [Anaerolineae bacterium]|nr:sugar kinase [Anaerolineae bacterium]